MIARITRLVMIICAMVAISAVSYGGAPAKNKPLPDKKQKIIKQPAKKKPAKKHKTVDPSTLPTGVMLFDTEPATGKTERIDRGYPTIAAASDGKYLWLGRRKGLRRYDVETGAWTFFELDSKICPGTEVVNVVLDPPFVWARITSSGRLCRLNPQTGEWTTLDHWTVLQHTGSGFPLAFEKDLIYVASSGSPDWEGVSIIDRASGEWMKLLRTKPPQAMHIAKDYIWLGLPEGILRIDKITEDYRYYQPGEHGGGALIKDIISIPDGLAFATLGDRTQILGDKMQIKKDSIRVYVKKSDKWFDYSKKDRAALEKDVQDGKVLINNVDTHPGLLLLRNGKWRLLTTVNGLPGNDILNLEKDDRFMYICTSKGFSAMEMKSLKVPPLNREITARFRQTRRIIADDKYIWAFNNRGLFRILKRMLFSEPRPSECGAFCDKKSR